MARRIDTEAEIDWIREADQAGDPASPAAGYKYIYVKSGGLYLINSAGTVVGPIKNVATDTIWDAAGDLVYGTGADAASKLSVGTATQVLAVNAGATAPEWTSAIGACVKLDSAESIANGTPTAVPWDSEVRDDGGCWAAGNPTRLVAPVAGWYVISAWAWWDADNDGGRRLYIQHSAAGATIGRQSFPSSSAHNDGTNSVSAVYYMAAAEYVEIYADQNAGGALNIKAGAMAQIARIR